MNLGVLNKPVNVQDLYNYAKQHNLLNSEVSIVLNIISRERNLSRYRESNVSPTDNIGTIDFGESKHYTTEEVIQLFNS